MSDGNDLAARTSDNARRLARTLAMHEADLRGAERIGAHARSEGLGALIAARTAVDSILSEVLRCDGNVVAPPPGGGCAPD